MRHVLLQLLVSKYRLVDQSHVIAVLVVLMASEDIGESSRGARIVVGWVIGGELYFSHEWIGLRNHVLHTNRFRLTPMIRFCLFNVLLVVKVVIPTHLFIIITNNFYY